MDIGDIGVNGYWGQFSHSNIYAILIGWLDHFELNIRARFIMLHRAATVERTFSCLMRIDKFGLIPWAGYVIDLTGGYMLFA